MARATALVLALCSTAVAQEVAPPAAGGEPSEAEAKAAAARPFVRGQLSTRYWLRWNEDDSDNDVFALLSADFGDEDRDAVTGHVFGRLTYDLDGRDGTFSSINDAYGRSFDGLLYDAYADLHRIDGFELVRLGRQSVYETPVFAYFDGVHVRTAPTGKAALQLGGYFGSSVHLYEASKSGDLTGGVYGQLRPWQGGRVRVDYMHLEDYGRLRSHKDGVLGANWWQNLGKHLQLDATYSRIEGRDRDARGRIVWRLPDSGAYVQASYYRLLRTQGDLVLEADPYFAALNELRPYDQWSVLGSKTLGEHLELQAAGDLRRVDERGDVGVYNRDYDHWYGTAIVRDLLLAGLSLSGTADFWDSNAQLVRSWGGDATYTFSKSSVSLGTYYSLYKYDLFLAAERDHVRTYYCRIRHRVSDSLTIEGDYELEDVDFSDFHRLRLGVTWRF